MAGRRLSARSAARKSRARPAAPHPPAVPARAAGRLAWASLAIPLALALFLRLWHLRQGLPDFLDEAIPFRRALRMWDPITGAVDWNPHLFHYPSLTFYLQLALQKLHYFSGALAGRFAGVPDYMLAFQTDPTPHALLARLLCVAFDLVTVWGAWRLGRRLGAGVAPLAALLAACAPTLILTARSIYTDTFLAALSTAAVAAMLAWHERGGWKRLALAAGLIGLAAGAKYPGAVLIAPLALVAWSREGRRGAGAWAAGAGIAAVAFLATTPFALLDRATFLRDFGVVRALTAEGHLGNLSRAGFAYHLENLTRDLGWPGVVLLALSLGLAAAGLLAARRGRGADLVAARGGSGTHRLAEPALTRAVLWFCLLLFGIPIALARIEVERYLAPVLPFAALLAADAGLGLAGLAPARLRPAARAAVAALVALPALFHGFAAGSLEADATRIAARRWLERHVTARELVLQEQYAAPVLDRITAMGVRVGAVFRAAGEEARRAFERKPSVAAVGLPLAVAGRVTNPVRRPDGSSVEVQVLPHAVDLNAPFYDPRVLAGVDLVATSSTVRGRFERDLGRFSAPHRFYALLDSTAEVAARFEPRGARTGPLIVIYRLTPRTRAAIEALGPLPPLWWAEAVPQAYRDTAERILTGRAATAMVDSRGEPAPWVRSLEPMFRERYAPFAQLMGIELMEHRAYEPALRLAAAILLESPDDVGACLTYTAAAGQLGRWDGARAAIERTMRALGDRPVSELLLAEHRRVLARGGAPAPPAR